MPTIEITLKEPYHFTHDSTLDLLAVTKDGQSTIVIDAPSLIIRLKLSPTEATYLRRRLDPLAPWTPPQKGA